MDNKNYEIELIQLFKDGKITEYVLERELGKFLGERVFVKIVKCFHHTARTFVVFPAAEVKSNGIFLNVYIDEGALLETLSAEEMFNILRILRDSIQSIYRSYMNFVATTAANSLTVSEVLAEYLKQYAQLLQLFEACDGNCKKVLHSLINLNELIEKLDNGHGSYQDIEELIIKDYIPREILELSEKISENSGGESGLQNNIRRVEIPSINLCQGEIRQYAKNSIKLDRREIPHDYRPSTNQ